MIVERYDAGLPTAERKRHGIFYTPDPVVRYLLRATAPRGPVADLSCGDGAFLLEAAQRGLPVMGIDRDKAALANAAERLASFPADRWHLHYGDGLTPVLPWTPDVVLGNPPYLEAKKTDAALKARCRRLFPHIARGGFDVFVCFVKAGLDVLPPGGRLGYIIPNKCLIAEYARPLREEMLAQTTIEQIIDVSDLPTFRDAAVYPVMLVLRKELPAAGHTVRTGYVRELQQLDNDNIEWSRIRQADWLDTSRRVFWLPPTGADAHGMVARLMEDTGALRLHEVLDLRWTVSFHRGGLRDQFIFPTPTGANPQRLLGGKRFHGNADVQRYRTAWSGWWIDYDEVRARELHNQLPALSLFQGPKLLIAQNARRVTATLDTDGFVCKDTFIIGRAREGEGEGATVPLEYLLGLLNSALMSYLYGILFKATHVGGSYLHYLACYLDDLPIRLADDPGEICGLVRQLLDPRLTKEARLAVDRRLDLAVYDLYDLSPAERALIDQALPAGWGEGGMRRGQWDAGSYGNG
ncbi:MAG: Eco57I restriction-modification methylase domain-containing protein [Armatimonadota bacterium]